MKYVSIDLETTGLDEKENQIIEFAAIIEDSNHPLSFEDSPKYQRIVLASDKKYVFGAYAAQLNHEIMAIIANIESGKGPMTVPTLQNSTMGWLFDVELLGDFTLWLFANGFNKDGMGNISITAAGKNFAGFDKRFIEANSEYETTGLRFKHRSLDPTLEFIDWKNDHSLPSTDECLKRAGIEKTVSHRALDDAWDVIQLLRKSYDRD